MAGRGPAPKPASQRRRRNKPAELKVVKPRAADSDPVGPDLPDGFEWPDATTSWWETWRKSPQAETFTDTDWSFLLDTAVLHAEFWLGNRALAGELRLRAAKFGATPEDRARLKMAVGDPPPAPAAGGQPARLAKKTAARKQRLLKAVDGGA